MASIGPTELLVSTSRNVPTHRHSAYAAASEFALARAFWPLALASLLFMSIFAHRLESGLRVSLCERPGAGTVSISAWIGAGSADDPIAKPGLAHLFEHMLFKGTNRRAVGEIARELEAVGGDINAWTTFDNIVVQLRVPPDELARGLDVLADMLVAPVFDRSELELERDVVMDELDQANADPHRALGRHVFANVFRRHPYRRPILGTHASIARILCADLREFANRAISADNVILSIAGELDVDSARVQVEKSFTELRRGPAMLRDRGLANQRRVRSRVTTAPVAESQVIVAFPSPPQNSRQHLLLDMISIALGQGASSVLARNLEGADGLATSSGAYVHGFRDAGLFIATASSNPDDSMACAEKLAAHVFATCDALLETEELAMVKNAISSDSVYGRETVGGLAAAIGSSWSHAGDPNDDRRRLGWARAASSQDLRTAARAMLRPERATIVAMGPELGKVPNPGTLARMIERVGRQVRSAPKARSAATRRVQLPGGTVVVVHRDDTVPLVAAQATWRGGLRLEDQRNSGIGALLARTITRGCGPLNDAELAQRLDREAATLSGFSGRNSFGLRAEWLADSDGSGLELLLQCIESPTFEATIVERERRRLSEEAAARRLSPGHLAHSMFTSTLHGAHPYGLDVLGSAEPLDSLSGVRC